MAQVTQVYRRSMSSSVSSGLGSILGGAGRQYYILEHKNNSQNYKIGQSQEIIVDQIEIGRDPKCQVYFDESFKTVSRRHAAIVKADDTWKLVQLSNTNPTFLNGEKVEREWLLQNGDEIQLSYGGPKLGFIIPTGKKSTVGSIKVSRRISLFRQQAWKPYSKAIMIAGIILCVALVGFVGWMFYSSQMQAKLLDENVRISNEIDDLNRQIQSDKFNTEEIKAIRSQAEALVEALKQNNAQTDAFKKEMDRLHKKLNAVNSLVSAASAGGVSNAVPAGEITDLSAFVFAITLDKTVITFRDGTSKLLEEKTPKIVGAGFLLDDGRFITARHVLEPWFFFDVIDEPNLQELNLIANNSGSVVSYFTAISSSGKRFSFNNTNAKVDRSSDRIESIQSGRTHMAVQKGMIDNTNWASIPSHETSSLKFNNMLSANLQTGMELEVLGFSYGKDAENVQQALMYSTCNVAKSGLDDFKTISVSNDNTERGNAGGPVFIHHNGFYQIVGVSSGSSLAKGRITPISAVY